MTKHRHNKKRNTGFLYNAIIRELAKASISKDTSRKENCKSLFKEHFAVNTLLRAELELFKQLEQSAYKDEKTAERILGETRLQIGNLNFAKLEDERAELARSMKKKLGDEVFRNFVPNYTHLASISQIFNSKSSPKNKILLENEIIQQMCAPKEDKKLLEPIDSLVVKSFIKRFNETYASLEEEQATLLNKYILSFSDEGTDLKLFLESELVRIKGILNTAAETTPDVVNQRDIPSKLQLVLQELETFKKKPVDDLMVEKVLKAQKIVKELS